MNCPRCNHTLEKVKTDYGMVAMCQSCFGHFLLEKNILQYIPADKWNKTLNHGKNQSNIKRIHCSSCNSLMDTYSLPEEFNSIQIDRCVNCKVIWFDKDKIEELNLRKLIQKKSITNNANLDYLAKGLLLDIKLDHELKAWKGRLANNNDYGYGYGSDGDFGFYDSFSGDSDSSGSDGD